MKRIISMLLALAMLLGVVCAAADDYEPGEITNEMMYKAFHSGKRISVRSEAALAINAAMMGLTQEEADAVAQILETQKTVLGVRNLDRGISVDFQYEQFGEKMDATVDLTLDGIAVRSDSLMPGEQFTAQWKTVLMMMGMDEAGAEEVMAMLGNWEKSVSSLLIELEQAIAQLKPLIEPYIEAANAYPLLDGEIIYDVQPVKGYPKAEKEIVLMFTDKDLGGMLLSLVDVLEKDETLLPVIAQAVSETVGVPVTGEEIIEALRSEIGAALQDDRRPYRVTYGYDDDGDLLYVLLSKDISDEECLTAYVGETDEEDSAWIYGGIVENETSELVYGVELKMKENEMDGFEARLEIFGDTPVTAALDVTTAQYATEDERKGEKTTGSFSLNAEDMEVLVGFDSDSFMNTMGGENTNVTITANITGNGVNVPLSMTGNTVMVPEGNGNFTSMSVSSIDAAAIGFDQYETTTTVIAEDYAAPAAAQNVIALETASEEELTALVNTVSANLSAFGGAIEAKIEEIDNM